MRIRHARLFPSGHSGKRSAGAVWMQTAVLAGPYTAVCIQTAVYGPRGSGGAGTGGDLDVATGCRRHVVGDLVVGEHEPGFVVVHGGAEHQAEHLAGPVEQGATRVTAAHHRAHRVDVAD